MKIFGKVKRKGLVVRMVLREQRKTLNTLPGCYEVSHRIDTVQCRDKNFFFPMTTFIASGWLFFFFF